MSATDARLVQRDGHIETWTLNLPDSRNPISDAAMVEALCDRAIILINGRVEADADFAVRRCADAPVKSRDLFRCCHRCLNSLGGSHAVLD